MKNSIIMEETFEEVSLDKSIRDFSVLFNGMSSWYHKTIKEDMRAGNSQIIRSKTIEKLMKNYETITEKYSEEEIINLLNNSLTNETIFLGKYGGEEINSTLSEEIFSASATFARYIINKIELDKKTTNKNLSKHLETLYPFLDSKTKKACEKFLDKKLEETFDDLSEERKELGSVNEDFSGLHSKLGELYYNELIKANNFNKKETIDKIAEVYEKHLEKYPGDIEEYLISKEIKEEINSISFDIFRAVNEINRSGYYNYNYHLDLISSFLHENLRRIRRDYLDSVDNSKNRLVRLQTEIKSLENQLSQVRKEIAESWSLTNRLWKSTGWFSGKSEQAVSALRNKAESLEKQILKLQSQISKNNLEAKVIVPRLIK